MEGGVPGGAKPGELSLGSGVESMGVESGGCGGEV